MSRVLEPKGSMLEFNGTQTRLVVRMTDRLALPLGNSSAMGTLLPGVDKERRVPANYIPLSRGKAGFHALSGSALIGASLISVGDDVEMDSLIV